MDRRVGTNVTPRIFARPNWTGFSRPSGVKDKYFDTDDSWDLYYRELKLRLNWE